MFYRGPNTSNNYSEIEDGQSVYGWIIDPLLPAGRTFYRFVGGFFYEIDSYFNQSSVWQWSTFPGPGEIDIQSVAVHELGHWLGLTDEQIQVSGITCPSNLTCPGNVMWGSLSTGTTRRVLSQDDKFGIQSIYPILVSNTTLSTNRTVFEVWSGNITVTNNLHITCGVTVKMTSGTLTIPSGGRLYVDNHATLQLDAGVICNTFGAEIIVANPCGTFINNAGCSFFNEGSCLAVGGIYEQGSNTTVQFADGGFLGLNGGQVILGDGASIVIQNTGNSRIELREASSLTFGNGSSVTVNGKVQVFDNKTLNLPNNSQFYIHPGARFEMGQNSSITVAGTFNAVGEQQNPVTFTLLEGATSWNGLEMSNSCQAEATFKNATISGAANAIVVGEQANFTMDSCTIENSSLGVQIIPYLGECPVVPAPKYITNNAFASVSEGILVNTSAETHIVDNTISGWWYPGNQPQELSAGVRCIGSSPRLLRNQIEYFGYGLQAMGGSSPLLEDEASGGYNLIRNNNVGVKCQDESNTVLGFVESGNEGGMNSIYGNLLFDVVLLNKSIVYAQNNWWGTPEDPYDQFSVDVSSELFYVPWLDYDPNGGNGPVSGGKNIVLSSNAIEGDDPSPLSPGRESMRQALAERMRGRYNEALLLLRTIIANGELPAYARHWAVSQLVPVSERLPNPTLSNYLATIETLHPELIRGIRAALPQSYILERGFSNAIAAYEANIQRYPNSDLERTALYGKFALVLFGAGDTTQARTLYNTLATRYPSSTERYVAELQLSLYQGRMTGRAQVWAGEAVNSKGEISQDVPEEFALLQNYPNPFNPSTEIGYRIAVPSFVSLNVYNMLGQQVATLVNEHKQPGTYNVTFDASKLASGTYFYRLLAGSYHNVKKFAVLK